MLQNLSSVLYSFEPISLEEMDRVKLLDRIDTKFVFNHQQLPGILTALVPHYQILEIKGTRQSRYETLYFDTPDHQLYLAHHNGRPKRYKVRYRKYVDSDLVFFEIKYKDIKGRTHKSRIKRNAIDDTIEGESKKLLSEKTPLSPEGLLSNLWVYYSRITLVKRSGTERLTLDLDLHYKKDEQNLGYENVVIAEVKQDKLSSSPFIDMMKTFHVHEGSISKYCLGMAALDNTLKKNNFKPHVLTLNKLCYDSPVENFV